MDRRRTAGRRKPILDREKKNSSSSKGTMGTSQVHLAISPTLTLILISPRKREKGRAGQSKLAAPDGGHPRGSSAFHGGARQPRRRLVAPWERPWT